MRTRKYLIVFFTLKIYPFLSFIFNFVNDQSKKNVELYRHLQSLVKGVVGTVLKMVAVSIQWLKVALIGQGKVCFFSNDRGERISFHRKCQGKFCFLVKSQGNFC